MKTAKQATIEYRDEVFTRLQRNRINKISWEVEAKKHKKGTPESDNALEKVKFNADNIKLDIEFLKVIDKELKKYK